MSKGTVQRFETGISANNLRHWGMLEVVKEFLQNAVFAKTILGNEISIEATPIVGGVDGEILAVIKNTPDGFTRGKLLIGESEQADVAGAPGQYGEGMKAAMAVARRLGMECEILTNGMFIKPELEPSSLDPELNALVFYIEDVEWNQGTEFRIRCTEEILEKAKTYFAVLEGIDEELVKVDSILDDYENVVYVNGVMITETPTVFGYNFTDPELMNRDRTSINHNKLKDSVKKMILELKSQHLIEALLQGLVADDTTVEAQLPANYYYPYYDVKDVWKKAGQAVFGTQVAIATGTDSDAQARYRRYKLLTTVPSNWKQFFSDILGIKPSDQIEGLVDKPKNKHTKPTAEENGNLGWAKRLIKLYYGDYGTVRVSDKVVDEHGNDHWAGLYVPKDDLTWLRRDILSSKELTFKVLLHETIHRITGAQDNTDRFTKEWEHATWMVLTRGKGVM